MLSDFLVSQVAVDSVSHIPAPVDLRGQFDLTYVLVELLEKIGVVWDVQLPSDAQIKAKLDASK